MNKRPFLCFICHIAFYILSLLQRFTPFTCSIL